MDDITITPIKIITPTAQELELMFLGICPVKSISKEEALEIWPASSKEAK